MLQAELVLALAGLLALGALSRYSLGSWIAPGAFFTLCWIFVILLSFSAPLFGVEQYPVWHGTLWWIVLTLAMVVLGSFVGSQVARSSAARPPVEFDERDFPWLKTIVALAAAGGFGWPILTPQLVVFGDHPPLYLQVMLGLHYIGPLFGGLVYPASRSRSYRFVSLLTILPGIFFGIVDTGRTKIVMQFTFWFAGYFAMRVFQSRGTFRVLTRGHVLAAALCLLFFFTAGVVFTPFRGVAREASVFEKFQEYSELVQDIDLMMQSWDWMGPSFFGHVAYFSWYFERAWANPPAGQFGAQTMAGLYRIFVGELPEPIYTNEIGGIATNVFTVFKPPIEDWTLWGSLVAFFGYGFMGGWGFQRVRDGTMWPMAMLLHFYTSSMNPGGWFLTYNSVTGSFVVLGVYLFFMERRLRASPAPAFAPA